MRWTIRWLVLLALPIAVAPRAVAAAHPALPPGSIEWLEPLEGAALIGGATARFQWRPGPQFEQLVEVEEWELFLSVDGGRTWPIRLTPHLSTGRRSIEVEVPNLSAPDARLMLRIGNETIEHEAVLPYRVEIRPGPQRSGILPPSASTTASRASPANEEDVAIWAAGDRSGGGIRWFARSSEPPCELTGSPATMRSRHGQPWCLPKQRRAASRVGNTAIVSRMLESEAAPPPRRSSSGHERSPREATCRSNR